VAAALAQKCGKLLVIVSKFGEGYIYLISTKLQLACNERKQCCFGSLVENFRDKY
jgi:hypothetical protein